MPKPSMARLAKVVTVAGSPIRKKLQRQTRHPPEVPASFP